MLETGWTLADRPFDLKLGHRSCFDPPSRTTTFLVLLSAPAWARVITTNLFRMNRYGWIQCLFQIRNIFRFIWLKPYYVMPSMFRACFGDIPCLFIRMHTNYDWFLFRSYFRHISLRLLILSPNVVVNGGRARWFRRNSGPLSPVRST